MKTAAVLVSACSATSRVSRKVGGASSPDGKLVYVALSGTPIEPPPQLGKATTAQLVATLENKNAWHRETAARLLFERQWDFVMGTPSIASLPGMEGLEIAFAGRSNVGKSSLINRILGEERLIAFDQPGTTRDSIYIDFERNGRAYTLIDTAGVVERYGINPEQVPDFIALRGDPSDGLPGARGVGAKGAAKLLREYGSLEAVIAAADEAGHGG